MKRIFLLFLIPLFVCGCAKNHTVSFSEIFYPGACFSLHVSDGKETTEISAQMAENKTLILEYQNAPVAFQKILSENGCEIRCGDFSIPLSEREAEDEALRKALFFLSGAKFEAKERVEKDGAECFLFSFFSDGIKGELLIRTNDRRPVRLILTKNGRDKAYRF